MSWFGLLLQSGSLGLIILIVKQRGLWSTAGTGLALLGVAVFSDLAGLAWYLTSTEYVVDIRGELAMRALPAFVLVAGLLSFWAGLYLLPQGRWVEQDPQELKICGAGMVMLGFSMKLYALYAWGFRSLTEYLTNTYAYDAQKQGGGFLDVGLDIALMGLAMILAARPGGMRRTASFLAVIMAAAFLLSSSKSGINMAIIVCAFTFSAFQPTLLRRLTHPLTVLLLGAVFVVGLGVKTEIKYARGGVGVNLTKEQVLDSAVTSLSRRFGAFGNYRGYCNLVNRVHADPEMGMKGAVILHVLTGWVPRFLWAEKPAHPFHATGTLVNDDFAVDEFSNDAPTLVGFAFADFGFLSALLYLFVGGALVAAFERYGRSAAPGQLGLAVATVFFSFHLGVALPESGLLSFIYYALFSSILGVAVSGLLLLRRSVRGPRMVPRQVSPA